MRPHPSQTLAPSKPQRIPYSSSLRSRQGSQAYGHQTSNVFLGFMPGVSIVCIVIGLFVSLALMPDNIGPPGVLRSSSIAMIIGLVAGPLLSAWANPRFLLRTENIIGIAPVYWLMLDMVTGSYEMKDVNRASVREAFIVIAVCMAAYWLATLRKPWRLPLGFLRTCNFKIKSDALLPIVLLCFLLAMLKFAIPSKFDLVLMFNSVTNSRWAAPWARGALGGWDAFADHLSYFGYLLPTLAVVMARRKGWYHGATLLAAACAFIFFVFLAQSGSRRIIGVCLGAALLYWIMDQKKIRPLQLLTLGTGLVGILYVMQVMIVTRSIGMGQIGIENAGKAAAYSMTGHDLGAGVPSGLHIDDNILRLSQSIMYVPNRFEYVYHKAIFQILVRPIPRVLWPNKPVDAGFKLYDIINTGASLSTTIIGEFWISWGYFAVALGGWFYGRLATLSRPLFDAAPETMAPMFYGYITMTLFVGFRSLVEVILFSYALMGWWLATWIISNFRK